MLRGRAGRLLAFACLYVSFGATLGVLGGAAPILLRQRGVALAQVGLVQLVYLPLGLSFLWATAVDRIRLPGLPHRVGWIAAAQATGAALLLLLARGEAWPGPLLLVAAVAVSAVFATMDVALEALVVDTVETAARPAVTTAKLCGSSFGSMLGMGVLAISYARLGWQGTLVAVALLDVLCVLPMLAYPEAALARETPAAREPDAPRRMARLLRLALLVGLYFGASGLVLAADNLFLLDLGLPLATVGVVTGTLAPAINLAATLASGAILARVAAGRLASVLAVGIAASGALLVLAAGLGHSGLAIGAVIVASIVGSGLGVPVFNAIYGWAEGGSAARDYSLLFGVGFLLAMPARVGGPALAGILGWPAFFAVTVPAYLACVLGLARAMRRQACGPR